MLASNKPSESSPTKLRAGDDSSPSVSRRMLSYSVRVRRASGAKPTFGSSVQVGLPAPAVPLDPPLVSAGTGRSGAGGAGGAVPRISPVQAPSSVARMIVPELPTSMACRTGRLRGMPSNGRDTPSDHGNAAVARNARKLLGKLVRLKMAARSCREREQFFDVEKSYLSGGCGPALVARRGS